MSFLLDPPLLAAAGYAIERACGQRGCGDAAAAGTLGTFWAVSGALWADVEARPLRLLWSTMGSESGRDFMVNSGVLSLPVPQPARGRHHAVAVALFATYPLALWLGRRLARSRAAAPSGALDRAAARPDAGDPAAGSPDAAVDTTGATTTGTGIGRPVGGG